VVGYSEPALLVIYMLWMEGPLRDGGVGE